MSEISGAIVSITLVMASVSYLCPLSQGLPGYSLPAVRYHTGHRHLYLGINALTLCPALAAMFLRPPDHGEGKEKKPPAAFWQELQ